MITKDEFIKNISESIKRGELSYFIGAGLSKGSGHLDWKELMEDFADELKLDIKTEHDLIQLAQFYVNKKRGRNKINEKIRNEFKNKVKENPLLTLMCELPVHSVWTTNFDLLIEETYDKINKKIDVKNNVSSLSTNIHGSEVTLYKMHGDVNDVDDIVIIRDDYEKFDKTRGLFTTKLTGELVTNTFLFIGYSFSDPNLHSILSKIRISLKENQREHYYITKKATDDYELIKQKLMIDDLSNYGIKTLRVDSYDEYDEIMKEIRDEVYKENIFVSGSAYEYLEYGEEEEAKKLIKHIVSTLIKNNYKIINGLGLGLADGVIQGLIEGLTSKDQILQTPFDLRVFPQKTSQRLSRKEQWSALRENMISKSRVAIFMFGNKIDPNTGKVVLADGMMEEFEIAKKHDLTIIPIVSTGYMASKIYDENKGLVEVKDNLTTKDIEAIGKDIIELIKESEKR